MDVLDFPRLVTIIAIILMMVAVIDHGSQCPVAPPVSAFASSPVSHNGGGPHAIIRVQGLSVLRAGRVVEDAPAGRLDEHALEQIYAREAAAGSLS
jgi:hypothetical protein